MKVLVLGGSGGMGRFTSRAINSLEGISSITIADLNAKAVEAFANSLKVANKRHRSKCFG